MNLVERRAAAAASRTLADRVIGYFSPRAGLDRLRARAMLSAATGQGGYQAGRRDRRGTKRWRPADGSADTDILGDLSDLRARSRDLARNVPIATGALATKVTNVVGDGLRLQASIDHELLGISEDQADAMEAEQEREFELFCKTCDFSRVQDFDEQTALVERGASESGDIFVFRRFRKDPGDVYGTKLQVIEADRVSNPNRTADSEKIAGGVEIDNDGVPVAYHVSDKHPGSLGAGALNWTRIRARSGEGLPLVLHLYERLRPEQTRGVPWLAPVIEHLKQLGDYSDAEVSAAVVSAMYTLIIETEADQSQTPVAGETDSTLDANELKIGNAATLSLNPGEKANFADPSRPNANFDPFFLAMTRQIGVALEIPQELLIKHFTASYSASRAALEMAWQFFRRRRAWLAWRFCQPAYEWMLEEAVASGRLARPGFFDDPRLRAAYCGAYWIGPRRISVDPKKEAEADKIDVLELRVRTRDEVCMERTGGEFEQKRRQLAKEQSALEDSGLDVQPGASAADAAEDGGGSDAEDETQPARRRA